MDDIPENKKKRLKVLREADYVIGPACAACDHATFPQPGDDMTVRCKTLQVHVSGLGRCKFFKPGELYISPAEDKRFLEKRAYSRSNRHKTTPRY